MHAYFIFCLMNAFINKVVFGLLSFDYHIDDAMQNEQECKTMSCLPRAVLQ
uniref:Uncharacterized protein n=1 Tax=Picea glauca TaxID=3330 RepID=A0A101M2D7_PICGL|nr:hypothetical protein ABT39_MTgene2878 [Picea glauca]